MHREVETEGHFLHISTESGQTMTISPNHLVPVVDCKTPMTFLDFELFFHQHAVFAEKAKSGLCLLKYSEKGPVLDQISKVERIRKRGIYAPVTQSGDIIVNDLYASCFSYFENHLMQRSIFTLLNKLATWTSPLRNWLMGADSDVCEIPISLQVFMELAGLYSASN